MGVIEWKEEDGIIDALVGGVRMARIGLFKREDRKVTWWQEALLGFNGDEAEYYCWTVEEAMSEIEETVDQWLYKAGLVPKSDYDYLQKRFNGLTEHNAKVFGLLHEAVRVATRYDRSPTVFFSAIALAATVIFWL